MARLAAQGGFAVSDFQDSARRLRPVELELEELLEAAGSGRPSEAEEVALLRRWRDRGYLERGEQRTGIFGRRLTSDAQGVDIGSLVPPSALPEADVPTVRPPSWGPGPDQREAAASSLQRWGCALLRGAVSPEDVGALRDTFGLGTGIGARRAGEVGRWLMQKDPNVAMGRYTFGRLHCLLRGSPELEPQAAAVHAAVAPLVHAFFRGSEEQGAQVFLSEAQLIVADPCADAQTWHLDSVGGARGSGLSVFVPLAAVPSDRGPQAVLPGTHCLSDTALPLRERLRRCLLALCRTHGAVSSAAGPAGWAAGDALVLDGRLLHRGLANDSLGAPVPVLVLRYDLEESPPPGCSRSWLRLMTRLGCVLEATFRLYAAV